jgi:vesicle coat complex subunit
MDLVVILFLNENHDLIILIVKIIQKDLKLDNYLVCCVTLTIVCKLLNVVLFQVVEVLADPEGLVRKKAIMALHIFH